MPICGLISARPRQTPPQTRARVSEDHRHHAQRERHHAELQQRPHAPPGIGGRDAGGRVGVFAVNEPLPAPAFDVFQIRPAMRIGYQ